MQVKSLKSLSLAFLTLTAGCSGGGSIGGSSAVSPSLQAQSNSVATVQTNPSLTAVALQAPAQTLQSLVNERSAQRTTESVSSQQVSGVVRTYGTSALNISTDGSKEQQFTNFLQTNTFPVFVWGPKNFWVDQVYPTTASYGASRVPSGACANWYTNVMNFTLSEKGHSSSDEVVFFVCNKPLSAAVYRGEMSLVSKSGAFPLTALTAGAHVTGDAGESMYWSTDLTTLTLSSHDPSLNGGADVSTTITIDTATGKTNTVTQATASESTNPQFAFDKPYSNNPNDFIKWVF